MKHKKLKLCVPLLLVVGLTGLKAQEAVPASGDNASGSGGSASYTVGQLFYTTNPGTTGSVLQGVQQPYEIITVGINETSLDIYLSVFPNPTSGKLNLQVQDYDFEKLTYSLSDLQGKLLEKKQITSNQTDLDLNGAPSGIYFLKIRFNDKTIQSFKIIKN